MKTLLIDAGNSRIKCGWADAQTGVRDPDTLAIGHGELDQLAAWLHASANHAASQAIGVNVAGPELADRLQAMLQARLGLSVHWIGSEPQAAGVRNAYINPAQLGADRWVSMIGMATHAETGLPLMLASFGTATTIDTLALDDQGTLAFQGGLIFPGPMLMRDSLASGTANLPMAQGAATAYPLDTHGAITSGIAAAQAGALLRQWREGLERYGRAPRVFCSGGGWPIVDNEVQRTLARAQADLGQASEPATWLSAPVLDGLARLTAFGGC
ncbi:type III pantothenate kinase [Allopusillimonas ginsengisoli]|uniref:type III pantothenate kinase n=1 Tax=Allopusillimonas ginsengisoli TaxID=453575 RepID=UPI00101F5867|nr:type III pantothenate kinase [Allopusillimonas ginsengisoli]TEA77854.1 type III pantothenate kinase [Allopusillimonas ginsengisoli]